MDAESIRTEVAFRFSRSSGPGGQHAQKTESRVEAIFDVEASAALTTNQKHRVVARAGPVLRAVAQDERSQLRNRETVTERFAALLRQALRPRKVRKQTRIPAAEKRKRLESKRQRAQVKRMRGTVRDDD